MEERQSQNDEEINVLDYLIVILKRKKMILGWTLGFVTFVTILVFFIMSNKYQAEVRFMPPHQSSSSFSASLLGAIGSSSPVSALASSLFGATAPGGMYVGLLQSRTVLDRIIDRFDLMTRYKSGIYLILTLYREDVREKLTSDVMLASVDTDSGVVTFDVYDSDPKFAASMANAFLDEMENLYRHIAITEASQRKLFYEKQTKEAKENLSKAEVDMKVFQEKTGVMQVDSQAQAVIAGDAAIRAQIAAKEVEIKVLKTYATANNPDLQKAEESLRAMRAERNRLETKGGTGYDPLMPTGRMPSVGLEYVRKLRDIKFYEAFFELLVKQFEAAKLDETKTMLVVEEVDRAVVPTKPAKPNRPLLIAAAAFLGFFFMVFVAFIAEFRERAVNNPRNKQKMELLRKYYCRRHDKT